MDIQLQSLTIRKETTNMDTDNSIYVITALIEWQGDAEVQVLGACKSKEDAVNELNRLQKEALVLMEKVEGMSAAEVMEQASILSQGLTRRIDIDSCITIKAEEVTVGKINAMSF